MLVEHHLRNATTALNREWLSVVVDDYANLVMIAAINRAFDNICVKPLLFRFKPKLKRFDADVIEGTIDCGYLNEIGVIINNHDKPFVIEGGTRIAQIVFNKHELPVLMEADELKGFDRGGGLGHTGTK